MNSIISLKPSSKPALVKFIFLAVVLALIVSLSVAQAQAKASTFTTNYRVDINLRLFVPCAAAGAGEFVQVSGPLHIVFVTTLDGAGGFQSKYEIQPKEVSGTGLSTGNTYQAKDGSVGTINGTVGSISSVVTNFRMVNQASGSSFLVRENVHVSANAKGGLTVSVDNFSVTCKRPSYPG